MGHMPSSIVEFQVWRLQQQQSRYVLVGTNTYPSTTGGSRHRNKLTLQVSTQQIIVQPGDIVGIFISSDGDYKIEFDGRRHDTSISTYIATSDVPLRGFNSSDLGGFQERAGAPLIRVTVEEGKVLSLYSLYVYPTIGLKCLLKCYKDAKIDSLEAQYHVMSNQYNRQ